MSQQLVEVEYTSNLAVIFIDRPQMNAYNDELLNQFEQILKKTLENEKIRAVIITGRGDKAFTVGADINWLESLDETKARQISLQGHSICNLLEQCPQVVIAAVNGYALGGGMELALACDLRIASTRAKFGQPEIGLGIIPGFDGTQRLPQLIGVGRAKEILFTGTIVDAAQAFAMGLVNKVVTPRDLLKESKKLASKIADQSADALGLIKNAINYGLKEGTRTGSEFETRVFAECFSREEHLHRIRKLRQDMNH